MALDNKAKAALAAAGFVSSGAFLYAARHLQSRINAAATSNGFTGDARELDMPDKLFGYSPQKLWDLFAAYGPKGRELFVKVGGQRSLLMRTAAAACPQALLSHNSSTNCRLP
jgi:hypothetical protein